MLSYIPFDQRFQTIYSFPVNRVVMMSASKYFGALLGPNFKEGQRNEVVISDIDGPTLKLIIEYCYTGNIRITEANSMQIVSAASAMELISIEQHCAEFWMSTLAVCNCVETYMIAKTYNLLDLRKKSFEFICEKFESVAITDLRELDFEYFFELLECDRIHALEEFIFQRMVLWIDHDEETRAKYAPDLLKLIRLEKITPPVLF